MSQARSNWLGCCSSEAVDYDQWQDHSFKARKLAQQQIRRITGRKKIHSKKGVSHTQEMSPHDIKHLYNNNLKRTNSTNATKDSLNPMEQSIILGRFDDLISQSSRLKINDSSSASHTALQSNKISQPFYYQIHQGHIVQPFQQSMNGLVMTNRMYMIN